MIYISIPISGHDIAQQRCKAESIKREITEMGIDAITPFDVCPEPGKPYSYYMGRDIEALLQCTTIVMSEGWEASKGCRAERGIAEIYGIRVIDRCSPLFATALHCESGNDVKPKSRRYRIKISCTADATTPTYTVQVRKLFGIWVDVKTFRDASDSSFAMREAEELLDKLTDGGE